jgi:LysR family cys regulon transcriptional activator
VGLIASPAYSPEQDSDLDHRDLSQLLPWETTWVAYHKSKYLRRFQQQFIEMFDRMIVENGRVNTAAARA